eukprot:Gb_13601 [translate_table: standard]
MYGQDTPPMYVCINTALIPTDRGPFFTRFAAI